MGFRIGKSMLSIVIEDNLLLSTGICYDLVIWPWLGKIYCNLRRAYSCIDGLTGSTWHENRPVGWQAAHKNVADFQEWTNFGRPLFHPPPNTLGALATENILLGDFSRLAFPDTTESPTCLNTKRRITTCKILQQQ